MTRVLLCLFVAGVMSAGSGCLHHNCHQGSGTGCKASYGPRYVNGCGQQGCHGQCGGHGCGHDGATSLLHGPLFGGHGMKACGICGGHCGGRCLGLLHHRQAMQETGPYGQPSAQVTYPYYTTRGPRDYFFSPPPGIGP